MDGAYYEHQQVYALFRLMDRTLQARIVYTINICVYTCMPPYPCVVVCDPPPPYTLTHIQPQSPLSTIIQALELLAQLAVYWEESNRVRLPLDRLRDVAFVDLVSAVPAQDAVKVCV